MHAASVGIPVREVTVALPPVISIELTITLVPRAKNMNVKCPALPQRTRMISRKVWAAGALIFRRLAFWANSKICTLLGERETVNGENPSGGVNTHVAPAAYLKANGLAFREEQYTLQTRTTMLLRSQTCRRSRWTGVE